MLRLLPSCRPAVSLRRLPLVIAAIVSPFIGSHAQQPADKNLSHTTVNIENPTVQHMMQHSASTFERGSKSYLDDAEFRQLRSSALSSGYRNDQPMGFDVHFKTKKAGMVWISLSAEQEGSLLRLDTLFEASKGDNTFSLVNLVPQTTYFYTVLQKKPLTSGMIHTEGQLRMIRLDSSWNIRDLGGWTGWGGNRVRYEQVYRGGSPGGQNARHETYFLSKDDIAELHRIGIRAHLDLRAMPGRGSWPDDPKRNAHSLGYTPMLDADFMNTATDFALHDALHFSAAVGNVAWVIAKLKEGKPIYFHCRTGADRTGVMGFTLLGLLGCDAYPTPSGGNQIAIDYELTSLGMDEEGTIAYNRTGKQPSSYSNRYANSIATSGYDYFRRLLGMTAEGFNLDSFQLKCYYYLNRYFRDNTVESAGRVFINKADLDWFINFMLGITDRDGHLIPPHTTKFTGPEWAIDDPTNSLSSAYETANRLQYK